MKTDFYLTWKDRKGIQSEHRVQIYEGVNDYQGKQIVLVTEELGATGVSVTNGCDEIATELSKKQLFGKNSVFIEHYERETVIKVSKSIAVDHDLALVNFSWDETHKCYHSPKWQPFSIDQFYQITHKLFC